MKLQIETTEAIWRRYRKNRDISTRNELLTRYAPLVHRQAARSSRHLSAQVSVDEIASAAFDGLMDAVATFDPDRGFKFETYAAKRILGAIHDWLRSIDAQSRGVRDFQKRQNAAFTVVSSDAGERASAPQIAERMGMTPEHYQNYVSRVRKGVVTSLSARETENDDSTRARRDEIHDHRHPSPQKRVEREMLREYLMRGLCRQDREVILLYYYDGLTLGEAGKVMGLSESRISQIHKRVLSTLRQRFVRRRELCAVA